MERLSGRGQHVEDIVQEVFLTAQRRLSELAASDDPRRWLYATATHLIRHHRRSLARRFRLATRLATEDLTARPAQPDDTLQRLQTAEKVRRCVARLPMRHREVFVLYELEELEGAAIARVLGIPENTVWSRLRGARERFEKIWAAEQRRTEARA